MLRRRRGGRGEVDGKAIWWRRLQTKKRFQVMGYIISVGSESGVAVAILKDVVERSEKEEEEKRGGERRLAISLSSARGTCSNNLI